MVNFTTSVVLSLATIILFGTSEVSSIVGGQTSLSGNAPYIVALQSATASSFMCAGVLVQSKWVLTTAQCVSDKAASDIKILLGSHRLLTNKQTIGVNTIVRHPSYDPTTGAHDLALLQLSAIAPLSQRVVTIALNDAAITSDVSTVFYGWGALAYGSTASSNTLQMLYRRTLSTSGCRARITNLADGNVCATGPVGQAACSKDEGGPLVRYDSTKLVGIYTYGTQCSGRLPDVFVDIYTHKAWIESTAV